MVVTNDKSFLSGLDYTQIVRKQMDNGYECNFHTLKNTFNHLSTFLPEFLFVQVRNDVVVTKMHVKLNGYYNMQLEHLTPVDNAPHPTKWFSIPGGPVEFVDHDIPKCDAETWFDLFDKACVKSNVQDIDFFVNPYHHPCMRKDGKAPFYNTKDTVMGNPNNKYMPILTASHVHTPHKQYNDVFVYGPEMVKSDTDAGNCYSDKPGALAWTGCVTHEGTANVLQYATDCLDVYNLKSCQTRTFCDTTRTLLDVPKCAIKTHVPENGVVCCQYLLHISDEDDKHTLLTKMKYIQKLILIPRHVKVSLKSAVENQHYMTVSSDLSDLESVLKWCNDHPVECQDIVAKAKTLAEGFDCAYMMGKTLNVIRTQSCTTNIKDLVHGMSAWEKSFFDTKKQRDVNAWEEYPVGHLDRVEMHPLSESYARGCADLLTHPKFSIKDHAKCIVNAVNTHNVADTEQVCERVFETVNGLKFVTRKYSSTKYMVHDFTVGTLGTNPLRKDCSNFQYVYGNYGYQTMVEYLNGPTLAQWLQSSDFDWKTLTNILLQVCMALNYAYNMCDFAHYELTTHNIVLVKHHAPQYYMFDNKLHCLPPCGFRAVIQRLGSSRCAVYREGNGGLMSHQMFDLFNPYHRPCMDILILMTHTFQTLCNIGVDISRAAKDYVESFFGYKQAFNQLYTFGSLWKHSPCDDVTIAHYLVHMLTLNNVDVSVVHKEIVLSHEPGYYKHVYNVCKDPKNAWRHTLKQLEEMSMTFTDNDLFLLDYVRICHYYKRIFPFVDCFVPEAYGGWWSNIREKILRPLQPHHRKSSPNHMQRKDDFYRLLTEMDTLKVINRQNWMACIQKMHHYCRAVEPSNDMYCTMEAFLTTNVGKILHDISQRNML